jgi:hypothetical protein
VLCTEVPSIVDFSQLYSNGSLKILGNDKMSSTKRGFIFICFTKIYHEKIMRTFMKIIFSSRIQLLLHNTKKMIHVETVPRIGIGMMKENSGGGEVKYDIFDTL